MSGQIVGVHAVLPKKNLRYLCMAVGENWWKCGQCGVGNIRLPQARCRVCKAVIEVVKMEQGPLPYPGRMVTL